MSMIAGRATEELEKALGSSVRALRIARSLTQVELADRANVALGALKHLESGAGATTSTLVKVVRALDATDWLAQLAPAPAPFNPLDVLATKQSAQPRVRSRVRHRVVPG